MFVRTLFAACLGLLTFASNAQSEQDNYFGARHVIGVGVAHQDADTELRASTANLPEVAVDLEDLGMGDSYTSWALEYRWRFAERWMLVGSAYNFDEDGRRTVERDFNFDGTEFQAGVSVDTELSIDTYILDVLYQVYRSDSTEILLGGGLHAFDLEASISGRAFVGDRERESASAGSELLAPLPNFRFQALHRPGERWLLGVAMGWLSANYEDFDGSFVYVHPRVGYWFNNSLGITLGYQYVDIDLTQEKSSNRETALDATFTGPTAYLNYRF